jgi:hypothetical protein
LELVCGVLLVQMGCRYAPPAAEIAAVYRPERDLVLIDLPEQVRNRADTFECITGHEIS